MSILDNDGHNTATNALDNVEKNTVIQYAVGLSILESYGVVDSMLSLYICSGKCLTQSNSLIPSFNSTHIYE